MEIVLVIAGFLLGFLAAWFFKKNNPLNETDVQQSQALQAQLQQLSNERSGLKTSVDMLTNDKASLTTKLDEQFKETLKLTNVLSAAQTSNQNLTERLEQQKQELADLQLKLTKDFELIANKILEEKTQKFTDQNKQSLDVIITPLKDRIKDFEDKVQKVYDTEAAERNVLKGQIVELMGLNKQMHSEAQNLTKALKGDNKAQGNWGEFILESILEKSGLMKDREYRKQASVIDAEGNRFQPDVVINLPDGKCLVVDSKVSLVSYEKYSSAQTEAEQMLAIKEHLLSLRTHIKGLSEKKYQSLYGIKSLDFVLLFMPIEPAFALAVQHDNSLFNDAFERNIVIVSPTTLLATLRTVANIWRQEYQNKNAIEIAEQAGKLYDKFEGLIKDLLDVGKKMNEAKGGYDEAMKKISIGPGNLVKKVEDLKKLGAKATKSLPPTLLERAQDDVQ